MAARIHSLIADKGATFRLAIRYRDPSGTPINLSGYTAMLLRLPNSESASALDEHEGTTDEDGWIVFTVADEDTEEWEAEKVRYRVQIENPSGEVDFLLVGPFTVRSPADV